MGLGKIIFLNMTSIIFMMLPAFGAGQHMMESRVPAEKLKEARALKNPLTATPDILEKGKAIYEGKGTCFNCHGMSGRGDGPGAATLNPPARVFKSHGFWKHRTEGEIFWVIKHGSPGTAMIPFAGLLSDEEIWTVMLYERSFAGGQGHRGSGHGPSEMKGRHGKQKDSKCKGEHEGKRSHGKEGHRDGDCQSN
jgi:mono/diheme cytochrome c family protein